MIWLIVVAVLLVLVVFAINSYNRVMKLHNEIGNAFGQIDVQLKRRYDLIPNLVEAAKKYISHEKETLEAVIAARSGAMQARDRMEKTPASAGAISALSAAEGLLGGALGKLSAVIESYPELKADSVIKDLSEQLVSTENRVAFARQAYNDSVLLYNNESMEFPTVIVARLLGYGRLPMLEAIKNAQEREAPKVQF